MSEAAQGQVPSQQVQQPVKAASKPAEPAVLGDPPIPDLDKDEEWADPKPEYSMAWLRACARSYGIKYGPRSSAETLCQRIIEAMYDGGEE